MGVMLCCGAMQGKLAVATALVLALGLGASRHDALACGSFVEPGRRVPRMGTEQTLITFDPQAGREHFVRKILFRDTDASFAFVVPLPSRPEVAKVSDSVFDVLQREFPFREASRLAVQGFERSEDDRWRSGWGGAGTGSGAGFGSGSGRGEGARGVKVVSVDVVGSFTVAVLQADEAGALEQWLSGHGFVVGEHARPWLARYTKQGFHFAAFRYAKAAQGSGGMISETVRISFSTPQPFYPYREPPRRSDPSSGPEEERLLRVWFIAPEPMLPVALRTEAGQRMFLRPWVEGMQRDVAREALKALPADILPPGDRLWLQAFRDQKPKRDGWSDAILVPARPTSYSPEQREQRRSLAYLWASEASP